MKWLLESHTHLTFINFHKPCFNFSGLDINICNSPLKKTWFLRPYFFSDLRGRQPNMWSAGLPNSKCQDRYGVKNDDLPIKNGDLPIKNGDLPIKRWFSYGFIDDLPIKNCDLPIKRRFSYGFIDDLPIKNADYWLDKETSCTPALRCVAKSCRHMTLTIALLHFLCFFSAKGCTPAVLLWVSPAMLV